MSSKRQKQQVPTTSETQRMSYNSIYKASLESILRSALDEYNKITYDLKNFQHSTIKTYLWIATVVFAAELAFYADISGPKTLINFIGLHIDISSKFFKLLSSLSLVLSMAVFILGVDTMRGRKLTMRPTACNWLLLSEIAYKDCDENYKDEHRISLIRDLDDAIINHLKESSIRGIKLRLMSLGILISVGCAILTLLC